MQAFLFAATLIATHAVAHPSLCFAHSDHKQIALALLDDVFNKHDISAVDKYIGSVYKQHDPLLPDGPQALKNAVATFTNATRAEFGAIAADGDLVWVDGRYFGVPGIPDTSVTVDVFRFEDGKIVEHWDAVQTEVTGASGRPMFPIQGRVDAGHHDAESNKKAAVALLDEIFNKKDATAVDRYIGSVYLQHDPLLVDGPQALKDVVSSFTAETRAEFGAVVADGDLVWINGRYTGVPGLPTSVAVDIFRFENGKIVEHWDRVQREIPAAQTASGRPMFPVQP